MPESGCSIPLHVSVDRASVSDKMPFGSLLGNRLVSWAVENKTCMQAEVGPSCGVQGLLTLGDLPEEKDI